MQVITRDSNETCSLNISIRYNELKYLTRMFHLTTVRTKYSVFQFFNISIPYNLLQTRIFYEGF